MLSFSIACVALIGLATITLGSIGSVLKAREAALKQADQ